MVIAAALEAHRRRLHEVAPHRTSEERAVLEHKLIDSLEAQLDPRGVDSGVELEVVLEPDFPAPQDTVHAIPHILDAHDARGPNAGDPVRRFRAAEVAHVLIAELLADAPRVLRCALEPQVKERPPTLASAQALVGAAVEASVGLVGRSEVRSDRIETKRGGAKRDIAGYSDPSSSDRWLSWSPARRYHGARVSTEELFLFSRDPSDLVKAGDAALRVDSGIASRDALFDRYSAGLSIPDYFGRNWDALDECLCDLHWVPEKRVVILHGELPRLTEEEMSAYLQVLARAVEDWRSEEEHDLQVVFPESAEQRVRELLGC